MTTQSETRNASRVGVTVSAGGAASVAVLMLLGGPVSASDCLKRSMGEYDLASFKAATECADCHPQHYDEWLGSSHAYAVVDPVFWAANEQSYASNGIENFCITCHAPIADVTDATPTAHATEPSELVTPSADGVSCVVCHRIYDVTNGIKQLTDCEDHYFGPISDPAGAPHGAERVAAYDMAAFCTPCHDVNISNETHDKLTMVEFTGAEWKEANEAAGGTDSEPAIATCQECHMPAYSGPAAVGGADRVVHRHLFPGIDVPLVPFADSHRQYRTIQDLARTAAHVDVDVEATAVRVDVTNLVVGHRLPTGSAHARALWIHLAVTGADGEVYLESGDLDENGDLRDGYSEFDPYGDPWISSGESVFRQYMYDKDGNEVLAELSSVASVERQMLESGEVRTIRYDLAGYLPVDAAYPVEIEVKLLYRPAANHILRALGMDGEAIELVPTYLVDSTSMTLDGAP